MSSSIKRIIKARWDADWHPTFFWGLAAATTAAVAGGVTIATTVVNEQENDDDKQDPSAVVTTKQITQTHTVSPPYNVILCVIRVGGVCIKGQ